MWNRRGSVGGPSRITLKEILPAAILFLIFILLALTLIKSRGGLFTDMSHLSPENVGWTP